MGRRVSLLSLPVVPALLPSLCLTITQIKRLCEWGQVRLAVERKDSPFPKDDMPLNEISCVPILGPGFPCLAL